MQLIHNLQPTRKIFENRINSAVEPTKLFTNTLIISEAVIIMDWFENLNGQIFTAAPGQYLQA